MPAQYDFFPARTLSEISTIVSQWPDDWQPHGPPFQECGGVTWWQAMYRAPDQTMAQIRTAERDLAIERAREAEGERDEARAECERLRESGGMDRPDWALDEKVSGMTDAVSTLLDATEETSRAATQPTWIQVTVQTGTVDLQADEWIAEDGHLRVYRAGEEVAEFPPGQWKWVMVA